MSLDEEIRGEDAHPPAAGRLSLVDAVRGGAIVGVVFYHLAWDLGFLGFVGFDAGTDPGWRTFARLLAGTFLALVGVSLALAHRGGLRTDAFLRRLAVIALAAAAVSLATWLIFPDAFVYFGILHAIALFSVLALPALRLPPVLVLLAAAAVLALPLLLALPWIDDRWTAWIGLAGRVPPANDYVPVFPWFGVALAGLAATRIALRAGLDRHLARWRPGGPTGRTLVRVGRHTLIIYLLHQPVLLAVLYPLAAVLPAGLPGQQARFERQCAASCVASGGPEAVCGAACACSADGFAAEGLWEPVLRGGGDSAQASRIGEITRACYDRAAGGLPGFDTSPPTAGEPQEAQ